MSSEPDPGELEEQGQREANKLQEPSKRLAQEVEDVGQDWERKRSDESVPGAPMPEDESEEDEEEDDAPTEASESSGDEDTEDSGEDGSDEEDESGG
jgi:hypothetical protein